MRLVRIAAFALVASGIACSHAPSQMDRDPAADKNKAPVATGGGSCPIADFDSEWESKLTFYHFYVGQGDSTFIRTPSGTTVLIDAGLRGQGNSVILPVLKDCGISSIDYAVLTHPHIDHFGGWMDILKAGIPINKAFYIPTVIDDSGNGTSGEWFGFKTLAGQTLAKMGAKKLSIPKLGTNTIVDSGKEVVFDVVAVAGVIKGAPAVDAVYTNPAHQKLKDNNSVSIAQIIHYKNFAYWAGGDLTSAGVGNKTGNPPVEEPLSKSLGHVDVYHTDHHGSDTSSSEALLSALKPNFAVISAGIGGTNGDNTKIGRPGDSATAFHLPDKGSLVREIQHGVERILMTSKGETESSDHTVAIDVTKDPDTKAAVIDAKQDGITLLTDGTHYSFFGKNFSDSKVVGVSADSGPFRN